MMTKEKILYKKIDNIVDAHFYLEKITREDMAQQITSLVRTYDRKSIVKVYEEWKSDYRKASSSGIFKTLMVVAIEESERRWILDEIEKTIIKRKQGCLIGYDNISVFNKDTISWKELRKICGGK